MNIINKLLKFLGIKKKEVNKEIKKVESFDGITPMPHLENEEVKEVAKPKVKRTPKPKKENTSESKLETTTKKRQPRKKVENKVY